MLDPGAQTVLIVDDEPSMRETLEILLGGEGYRTRTAASAEAALEILGREEIDVVLTDMRMDELSGVDLLRQAKAADDRVEVLVMTAFAKATDAVEAMKLGAYDYLIKPFNLDELKVQVRRALERRELGAENVRLRARLRAQSRTQELVAESAAMVEVVHMIGRVREIDATVLITGESGVGKEIIARQIHDQGSRRDGPFIAVNCGALPENLIEAELFGHERGAFTGADRAKPGLLEQADRGTLFLDEVGELPMAAQVKLLRVLQGQPVRRLGGRRERTLDVRFLAATNRDLEQLVRRNDFREDLFYRLNVVRIHVPPLRERPEDALALAEHFARSVGQRLGRGPLELDDDVRILLTAYAFPGNVRELENIVERAAILARGDEIHAEHLPPEVRGQGGDGVAEAPAELGEGFDLEAFMAEQEQRLMRRAIAQAGGVRTHAAELLGLSFRQFRYKAKKYGL